MWRQSRSLWILPCYWVFSLGKLHPMDWLLTLCPHHSFVAIETTLTASSMIYRTSSKSLLSSNNSNRSLVEATRRQNNSEEIYSLTSIIATLATTILSTEPTTSRPYTLNSTSSSPIPIKLTPPICTIISMRSTSTRAQKESSTAPFMLTKCLGWYSLITSYVSSIPM